MRIRIQWSKRSRHVRPRTHTAALALAALLDPAALIAFTIAFWSLAAALHWTSNFFVATGFFSHWQSWVLTSAVLFAAARLLSR